MRMRMIHNNDYHTVIALLLHTITLVPLKMSDEIEERINYKNRAISNGIILNQKSNLNIKGKVTNKTIRHEGCATLHTDSNALTNVIIGQDESTVNLEQGLEHIDEIIPANRSTTGQSAQSSSSSALNDDGIAPSCLKETKTPKFHFKVKGTETVKYSIDQDILSRKAPHLAKLFPEGETKCEIDDVEPNLFGALLYFVEFDKLEQTTTEQEAQDLYLLMNKPKYKMDSLQDYCEYYLISRLCSNTAYDLLFWSTKNKAAKLRSIVQDYVSKIG